MTVATTSNKSTKATKATNDPTDVIVAEIIDNETVTETTETDAPSVISVSDYNPVQSHDVKITTSDPVVMALLAQLAGSVDMVTTPTFEVTPVKWNQSDVILSIFDGIHNGTIAYASPSEIGQAMNRITGGTSKTPEGRVSQVIQANRNHPSVKAYNEYAATHKAYLAAVETIKANAAAMAKLGVPAETVDKIVADALAALDAPKGDVAAIAS